MNENVPSVDNNADPRTWERVKLALQRDWDQTRYNFGFSCGQDLNQKVGDTVSQAAGAEFIPDAHVSNDAQAWSDEAALRYGYSSAQSPNFHDQDEWSDSLESALRHDWEAMPSGRPWSEVSPAVHYGWDRAKGTSPSSPGALRITV